jgi:TetR/AcrR family transcriptional regulator
MTATLDTKTLILQAAERLFARHGFAATTIKMIADESGENSALIYYYYDSKETLYREVLQSAIGSIAAAGRLGLDRANSPESAVRTIVAMQARMLASRPTLVPLIAREMVDSHGRYALESVSNLVLTVFERLTAQIRAGQASGAFRSDLDPDFAAVSTISQVVYFFLASPIIALKLGHENGLTPDDVSRFAAHASDFAVAALRADTYSPS